jgi:hypothetical protein
MKDILFLVPFIEQFIFDLIKPMGMLEQALYLFFE